jgi:hypothetical protein
MTIHTGRQTDNFFSSFCVLDDPCNQRGMKSEYVIQTNEKERERGERERERERDRQRERQTETERQTDRQTKEKKF